MTRDELGWDCSALRDSVGRAAEDTGRITGSTESKGSSGRGTGLGRESKVGGVGFALVGCKPMAAPNVEPSQ